MEQIFAGYFMKLVCSLSKHLDLFCIFQENIYSSANLAVRYHRDSRLEG